MIKSDKWIRRMAAATRMIEPFEPGQVREVDGRKIVSYGTSSYGYDIRCSREFKIFTNINSTIVDPKAFDAGSFVDFTGDVCIIPPDSFALARTIEYFRIPRNAPTICLGKCVTADTRVVDARTGGLVSIADMRAGARTVGLAGWKTVTSDVSAFVPQGRKPVFELRTRVRACASRRRPIIRSASSMDGQRWSRCSLGAPDRRAARGSRVRCHAPAGLGGVAVGAHDFGGPVPHARAQPHVHQQRRDTRRVALPLGRRGRAGLRDREADARLPDRESRRPRRCSGSHPRQPAGCAAMGWQ